MSEWTDIGEQLRKARESKDLDLKAVAHTTRIPLATLVALEESDYTIFPSPTYARSFLSQYSEFLGVDAHEWIEAFETGDVLSNVHDHGYLQDHHDHIGPHERQTPARKTASPGKTREEKPSGGGSSVLQAMTVLLVTALLIAGGIYAYKKYEPLLTGTLHEEEAEPGDKNQKEPGEPAEEPAAGTPKPPAKVVSTDAADTKTADAGTTLPPGVTPTTKPKDEPEPAKPRTGPPPKALVVEDEDEP